MSSSVRDGLVVIMHYTLKNAEGEELDSSVGAEPLAYLHGADNIVPGLESALTGKSVGDTVNVVVPPAEGYGERVGEPEQAPKSAFPEGAEIEPGMPVFAEGPNGEPVALWVVEVAEDYVVLDPNHPLAGETLHFDVEIVGIREATEDEMAHGHPHGPDGHGGHGH